MAFAQRTPVSTRTMTAIAVAGLHGVALYALMTGLAVQYFDQAATVLKARTFADDKPPPPPPEPVPARSTPDQSAASQVAREPVITTVPIRPIVDLDAIRVDSPISVDPIPFEPAMPAASPTPEKPAFAAKGARPRNDPRSWVTTDDYPTRALLRGNQGAVGFQLSIDAEGRVTGCRVTLSSGSADLDAATCRHAARRARFDPATDTSGARAAGTYGGSIRWVIPHD